MIREFAPAKVNLALHVTGRRPDGYHLLDSLVVFADVGDRIGVAAGPLSLEVTGPRAAGVPVDDSNLVLRAARLMGAEARITLEKHLPAAAGIGGGSSDAAATLRALARLTGGAIPADVLALGADVPVCLDVRPARMRGIGERVDPVPPLPQFWFALVNPGVAVSTPEVFRALERRDNPPLADLPKIDSAADLAQWLAGQRNDLEPPARRIEPMIGEVLSAIATTTGCRLARMSGSGATCFGIYDDETAARGAAAELEGRGWWVAAAACLGPCGVS